ncbi:Tautomerase/MIF [Russula brevipes]|nr:Tautomerase/MIF [Russula brevipes]
MPVLALETNVKIPDLRKFILNFSKTAATILSKPEMYISISYRYNEDLSFGGTFDPAFLLVVTSLGNITPEQNEAYNEPFFRFIKYELGTSVADRGYITYSDPGRAHMSYQGQTFAQIFGK